MFYRETPTSAHPKASVLGISAVSLGEASVLWLKAAPLLGAGTHPFLPLHGRTLLQQSSFSAALSEFLCWVISISIQKCCIFSHLQNKQTSLDPYLLLWLIHTDASSSVCILTDPVFLAGFPPSSIGCSFLSPLPVPPYDCPPPICLLSTRMESHGFKYHVFADNSHIYAVKLPRSFPFISNCLPDVSFGWLIPQN